MIPAGRSAFLPVFIGSLIVSLSAAPGCGSRSSGAMGMAAPAGYREEAGSAGVPVTKAVPHSRETLSEIRDREGTNPLPARGDTEIRSHRIPRVINDNCERAE